MGELIWWLNERLPLCHRVISDKLTPDQLAMEQKTLHHPAPIECLWPLAFTFVSRGFPHTRIVMSAVGYMSRSRSYRLGSCWFWIYWGGMESHDKLRQGHSQHSRMWKRLWTVFCVYIGSANKSTLGWQENANADKISAPRCQIHRH